MFRFDSDRPLPARQFNSNAGVCLRGTGSAGGYASASCTGRPAADLEDLAWLAELNARGQSSSEA